MSFLHQLRETVIAHSWVYDQIQRMFGLEQGQKLLSPHLTETDQKVVLDVGAGTGIHRSLIAETARYICLDVDPVKLKGFRHRQKLSDAILLGDGADLGLSNDSIDAAVCIAVSHHLSDQQLHSLFSELARVTREKVIFLDALDCPNSLVSRLLWKYDRGSLPRSAATLLSMLEMNFAIEHVEQYRIYHQYLLCIAYPKKSHDTHTI